MKWEPELKIISETDLMHLYHLISLVYNQQLSNKSTDVFNY